MKNIILLFLIAVILFSCNGNNEPDEAAPTAEPQPMKEQATAKDDFPLLAKYDCKTCHMADDKLAGPSYKEIAAKYSGADTAIKYLSGKIIKGGSGAWGEVPMTAHPNMPAEDAEQLASYIMSIK